MPYKGRRRVKNRTHVVENENQKGALVSNDELKVPRSAVIRRGKVEAEVIELENDLRKLMKPYTAARLKEEANNRKLKLQDYATKLSSSFGVTHLIALSQNGSRIFVRMARSPTGPTLGFHIRQFSLMKDVVKSQKRPYSNPNIYNSPAVVVTNNFGDSTAPPHVKLMRITFQAMFPAINVATVKLVDCRRVIMFNLTRRPKNPNLLKDATQESKAKKARIEGPGEKQTDKENEQTTEETEFEDVVEIRHYAIKAAPVGVDRKVRKIIQANIPNLSKCEDISDYILGHTSAVKDGGMTSDSEAEDEANQIVLPQRYVGKGNIAKQRSALKLVELGPRLCLHLVKVEKGLASGDVMYHSYVQKSPEEVQELKANIERAAAVKKQRRIQQEKNVAAKQAAKLEKATKRKANQKSKLPNGDSDQDGSSDDSSERSESEE